MPVGFGHGWLPHTEPQLAATCIITALIFALIAGVRSAKDKQNRNQTWMWHIGAQAGTGAMFPIFVIIPFVPYDRDLAGVIYTEPVPVFFAGAFGAGVALYALFRTHTKASGYAPRRKPRPNNQNCAPTPPTPPQG